jgi:hypothetical protein
LAKGLKLEYERGGWGESKKVTSGPPERPRLSVTGCQSRREIQKIPLSLAGKKLMPFDRNNNDINLLVQAQTFYTSQT